MRCKSPCLFVCLFFKLSAYYLPGLYMSFSHSSLIKDGRIRPGSGLKSMQWWIWVRLVKSSKEWSINERKRRDSTNFGRKILRDRRETSFFRKIWNVREWRMKTIARLKIVVSSQIDELGTEGQRGQQIKSEYWRRRRTIQPHQ